MFKNKKLDFLDKVIIKRTNRKKTISIYVKEEYIIILSPKLVSEKYLYKILLKKQEWITKKLCEQRKRSKILKIRYINGGVLTKYGEKKILIFKKSSLDFVKENKNSIEVYCPSEMDIKNKLEYWLKTDLEIYLDKKLKVFKKLMRVDYDSFYIKSFKRRLGSCSYSRKLSFNWKIVMMPRIVIDYIIIHELSHLKHFNHSKEFWELVERFCPDFKEHKNWIKKNQNLII
ncbi:MAG: hypothetical protein CMJ13_08430 [Pelagibacterales bacterium]|nr:hypothetical protein [Pelagibacterales bacterium]|tara:strand:- start:1182 stop:1871 length:690 start_codon:yes stop_codon:yes gene_type:complete